MSPSRRTLLLAGAGLAALAALRAGPSAAEPPTGPFAVTLSDAEWRRRLSPEAYAVLREAGTERPFSSPLDAESRAGTYGCAGCAAPVFGSEAKFDAGTGWPSFWAARPGAVVETADTSLGLRRTAVWCASCGGHLGHVFRDGPLPTGLRYCINGVALRFVPA